MALPEADELRRLVQELENLTGKQYSLNIDTMSAQEIATQTQLVRTNIDAARQAATDFNSTLNDSRDLAQAIAQELVKTDLSVRAARSSMQGLTNVATELLNEERSINALSEKRLETLAKQAKDKKAELDRQANFIKREGESNEQALERLNIEEDRYKQEILLQGADKKALKGKIELLENQKAILQASEDETKTYQTIIAAAQKRLDLEKATTKAFGLSGAALKGASSIANKFGMSHVSSELGDIETQLREEIRAEIEKNNGAALSFGKRFQFAGKAIGMTAKTLVKGMMDPLFLIGKIFTAFLDVNKAAVDFTRLTGQNATAIAGVNSRLATSVDFLETAAELTRQTGMAATGIFGPDEIGALAEAKNLLGLSAEQAGNLGVRSKVAGVSIDQYKEGIVAATNAYNGTNKAVVAHGVVLQDVFNTSDSIALSLGGNPVAISKAATAARALGLELSKVDDIAGSLMNFESSIEAELEAQLLTGKNINLAKARELALNNDLAGLSAELAKNGASAAEFSKMNRIQQESLAKALGMSRDELGKMAQQELLRAGASLEAQAAARGVSVEMMQQMNIQDRIQKSLDKLAQAFAPLLDAVVPIVEALLKPIQYLAKAVAWTLQWKAALIPVQIVAGAIAGYFVVSKISSFFKAGIDGAKQLYQSILQVTAAQKAANESDFVRSKAGDLYHKNSPQGKMIRTKGGTVPLSDTVASSGKDAASKGANMTGKQEGVKSLSSKASNKPKALSSSTKGGAGTSTTNSISKINATELIKGAAAMAIAAGAVYIFGKAVQELEKVEDYGRVAIGLGLFIGTMGATAAILYFAGPAFAAAAPVLLAFGAAVTLFGLGLNLATPAIEAFGNAATSILGGIKGLLEVLTPSNVLGLIMMGPALGSLALGLTALGASALFALPGLGVLKALSLLGPGLALAGNGIAQMADNMVKLASALNSLETEKLKELKSLIFTTAFAAPAIAASGAITELISGISGNNNKETSNAELLAKLDQVVNAISNIKGDVFIDGEDAGNVIFRNTLRR